MATAEPRRPLHVVLRKRGGRRLVDAIVPDSGESFASARLIQTNFTDRITSKFETGDDLGGPAGDGHELTMAEPSAADPSAIGLFELIAVDRIVNVYVKFENRFRPYRRAYALTRVTRRPLLRCQSTETLDR